VLTAHTSRLVTNSRSLSVAESQNAHLRRALETRTVIGQAQGILMAQRAIAPDAAFDLLRVASQRTNRKLHDVAMDVVASLGRRGQITVGPEPTADRRAPYLDGV
jgi:AmiR/NasT family two-component response regulator